MLQDLLIRNFQSHESSYLEFDKGINVIVGKSSSGKTAIVRALQWLFYNRPSGFSFHSNFSKESVDVRLGVDGHYIRATKDKKEMSYTIDDKIFSKIGQNVPDELSIINMSELNIQSQLDEHYLITKSDGEVAREINKITKTDKVDEWVSVITTEINDLNKEIKIYNNQLKNIKEGIYNEEWLKELKEDISSVEEKQIKLEFILEEYNYIEKLIDNSKDLHDNIRIIKRRLHSKYLIERVKEFCVKYETIKDQIKLINNLLLCEKEKRIFKGVVGKEAKNILTYVLDMLVKLENINIRKESLDGIVTVYKENKNKIQSLEKEIKESKKDFKEFLLGQEYCWVCGKQIDDVSVKRIMEGLDG